MSWRHEIRSGHLYDPSGHLRGIGYAGHGAGKNNPDWCDVVGIGPIPPGLYSIGPAYRHEHLGPTTMNLDPLEGTETYGRSLFRMHGENAAHPGESSDGCPVHDHGARGLVAESLDRVLEVI